MKDRIEIIYENMVPGTFIRRVNRFTAQVRIGGQEETVHVKNTGRLKELLIPDADVMLQRAASGTRKTMYDLISVYEPKLEWVNIDSLAPNALAKLWLMNGGYDIVRPEYFFGDSRIDFYMEKGEEKYLTEVKGCTLADPQEPGTGLFPDAPTERGVKHLNELARAAEAGYRCAVLFVIQMNGIHTVMPNNKTHPAFGTALEQAVKAGVQVKCLECQVEADRIRAVREIDTTSQFCQK